MTDENTAYVSYAHQDRDFVQRLAENLEGAGFRVSFDERLKPGDSWALTLLEAIESAQSFLAVLSPSYLSSRWASEELKIAQLQECEGKARVTLLMIRRCDLPGPLAQKTCVDFTQDYHAGFPQLLRELTRPLPLPVGDQPPPGRRREKGFATAGLDEQVALLRAGPAKGPSRLSPSDMADRAQTKCFVVMPFDEEGLDVVYEDFVRPTLEVQCRLACQRGDSVFGSNFIMTDILDQIRESDLILADLTGCNPNVLYEVGICDTLEKPVLLLTQSKDDIPFDLRHRRVLLYEYSPHGCKLLERALPAHIRAVLGSQT